SDPERPEFAIAKCEGKSREHEEQPQPVECGAETIELLAGDIEETLPGAGVFFALPDVEELFESIIVEVLLWKGLLPNEGRQTFVGAFVQCMREEKCAAGKAPVVIAHEEEHQEKNRAEREKDTFPRNAAGSAIARAAQEPTQEQ